MEERSTVAQGALLAAGGALFLTVMWLLFVDPPKKFDVQVYDAEAPIVDASAESTEGQQAIIFAARDRLTKDRAALHKSKPKTRIEVEKIFGRPADACTDNADNQTYCLWYYATKPPAEGHDQIGVTFDKKGRVVFLDN